MIVSIFGRSCVGKSTIARALAVDLGIPLRSCGEEIKRAARARGLDFSSLTDDDHRAIDKITRSWVLETCFCLVEGRFLDQVLRSLPISPLSICLTANTDARYERFLKRENRNASMEELIKGDDADEELRKRLYGGTGFLNTSIFIDTSSLTVVACVEHIKARIDQLRKRLT
jgi:cytidylate kinase